MVAKHEVAVITHRGLEPSRSYFLLESSLEAFQDHVSRGFGIEFDLAFLADGRIAVLHDATLQRLTQGKDTRNVSSLTSDELSSVKIEGGTIPYFEEILRLIEEKAQNICAIHFKGIFQKELYLDALLACLDRNRKALVKCMMFDLKPESAESLHSHFPELAIAASVAHPFDIERYNSCVHGTLLSIDQTLAHQNLYSWAWLDEWDLTDKNGHHKSFYTPDVFDTLKQKGMKIALVTPELHATSPGLYGGESHPDAKNFNSLMERMKTIINLHPDAICTDYPEEARRIIETGEDV